MNLIGIDPSITSTGMVVNGKLFSYSYNSAGYTKKGELTKWYNVSNDIINFRFHDQAKFEDYRDEQLVKLDLYRNVVLNIMTDIRDNIDPDEKTIVSIEGYSYGSSAGNLIDLVTFGTLLRDSIFDITEDIIVLSPMSLKLESCKMTYPPIEKEIGKKKKRIVIEHRNNDGLSGGKFTKREMYQSIIENENWGNDIHDDMKKWITHLKSIESEIKEKKIPKPHEDINDSVLLYFYLYKNY